MRSSSGVPCARTSMGATKAKIKTKLTRRISYLSNSTITAPSAPVNGGEEFRVLTPSGAHFHEGLQENFAVEQVFQLLARQRANLLERRAARADEDRFLPRPLDVNRGGNAQELGRILPGIDQHRHGVRHFLLRVMQNLFAHHFGGQKALRLVGQIIVSI